MDTRKLSAQVQFGPDRPTPLPGSQSHDDIAVFRVNRKTGGLVFSGHYAPVGNPTIIIFVELAKIG